MLLKLYIDYTIGIWQYQYIPLVYIDAINDIMNAFSKAVGERRILSFLVIRRKERLMSAYEILMVVLTIAILVVEVIKLVVSR
jgi:hypothetical protein